jgi:hypothetical protein
MLIAVFSLLLVQAASDLSATRHRDAVPAEIAAAIGGTISSGGVRASVGANTLTFWFVTRLPTSAEALVGKPTAAEASAGKPATWSDIKEGTLVGAVKIDKDFRDIRGRVVKAGTFTVRYGIQPANGDHLGVSPYRDFLLLSPAALDKDPAPRDHDGTIELSKEAIGGSHPAVLSIDPPAATAAPLSVATTELGHKAIIVEIPSGGGALRFGLVLIGKIEA